MNLFFPEPGFRSFTVRRADLLEPEELRQEIFEYAKKICEKYSQ